MTAGQNARTRQFFLDSRYLALATVAVAVTALYLFKLDGIGVLGPDEPRYAAIGRAMAATHDFITPRLWGVPWFEKPPLLYWMTAAGAACGLGPELSGRLPVALLSLIYLCASCYVLTRIYNLRVASVATISLATCGGWIAYSGLCLTDLPLAVCFSAAIFCALPLVGSETPSKQSRILLASIGFSIGLGVLAKGLVPIALVAPFAWFLRRYWKGWWIAASMCLLTALPWYAIVYARNGFPFVEDFFIKHHLQRLYSPSLLHVQPFYYYLPVFLGALFPWTPLLLLLCIDRYGWDQRRRFLACTVAFGLMFFSISRNKLPGYLLPLLPSTFLLIATIFERRKLTALGKKWLAAPALLIACIPLLAPLLPQSLMLGRFTTAGLTAITRTEVFYLVLPFTALAASRRAYAGAVLALCVVASGLFLKASTYPAIDREVSPRMLWRQTSQLADDTCDGGTNRDWIFGLSFYRGKSYEPCGAGHFRYAFRTRRRGVPDLVTLPPQ